MTKLTVSNMEVIQDQLLVTLDDKDKVAIVLSQDELELLIDSLVSSMDTLRDTRLIKMEENLVKLRDSAFGK